MKKIISVFLFAIILSISVFADAEVTFEEISEDAPSLLQEVIFDENSEFYRFSKMEIFGFLTQVRGKTYCLESGNGSTNLPVLLSGEHPSSPNCIWTGEYYYVRNTSLDGVWPNPEKYAEPLILYDENGNVVKKKAMRDTRAEDGTIIPGYNRHATRIGYLNGTYYCMLAGNVLQGQVIKSMDFENWEYTDEAVPFRLGSTTIQGDKMSFNQKDFYPINYEAVPSLNLFNTLGEWGIYADGGRNFYFTNDNVYFVKVDYPQNLREIDEQYGGKFYIDTADGETKEISMFNEVKRVFEDETNIMIDLAKPNREGRRTFRIYIPKEEIYRQLDEMKGAPYVRVADEILAFETPPVMEDDRTLVPMRFLFEQLGAEVEWDNDTQTATATIKPQESAEAEKAVSAKVAQPQTISFSIDNTTAQVNGQSAVMDVPARLVNDKTMVPLRFLSEQMGYTVTWDEATNTAIVE